jgi:hypothetical protein
MEEPLRIDYLGEVRLARRRRYSFTLRDDGRIAYADERLIVYFKAGDATALTPIRQAILDTGSTFSVFPLWAWENYQNFITPVSDIQWSVTHVPDGVRSNMAGQISTPAGDLPARTEFSD